MSEKPRSVVHLHAAVKTLMRREPSGLATIEASLLAEEILRRLKLHAPGRRSRKTDDRLRAWIYALEDRFGEERHAECLRCGGYAIFDRHGMPLEESPCVCYSKG